MTKWYYRITNLGEQWDRGDMTYEQYWEAVTDVLMNRDPNQYVIGPVAIGSCSEVV